MLELHEPPQYNGTMSAEFISEYNEDTISAAVEYMEDNMLGFNYVGEYIEDVQEIYSKYPDGEVELMRMVRAAQLITGRKAGDYSENVQAVYHGELLGLELINNLDPHVGKFFKTGYAQSFIQSSLKQDRPTFTEAVGSSPQARLHRLSESLQAGLSSPMYAHGLNPIYEEFGLKATSKLSDETEYQDLAMIGFRMIVTEALKPSINGYDSELLKQYQAPAIEQKVSSQTIEELERTYARSINQTEEMISKQEDIQFTEWENISHVRKALYKKYVELDTSEAEPELTSISTLEDIFQFTENQLATFSQEHDLVGSNDLLSVRGEFFGVSSGEERLFIYDQNTEIRGIFDGFKMVEVPSNRQLSRFLDETIPADKKNMKNLIYSLAIRIVDPIFMIETTDGEQIIEHTQNATIDIPLNYKNVTYNRIKAEELEPEA